MAEQGPPPSCWVCACGEWRVRGVKVEPWAPGRRRRPSDRPRPVYRLEHRGRWYAEVETLDEVRAALGSHFAHLAPVDELARLAS